MEKIVERDHISSLIKKLSLFNLLLLNSILKIKIVSKT
jgi:hypothetical protein